MSIYKDCDIRGIYGVDLTESEMAKIGSAIAARIDGKSIVVGGDFRVHTPQLKRALIQALLDGGADVIDVGQVSTPQLYFSKRHLGAYASAQVTASHNPAKYNGLKLMFGDYPVQREDIQDIARRAAEVRPGKAGGKYRQEDTTEAYASMLEKAFGQPGRRLRIVIDAGNGAMSEIAPRVMERLGMEVVPLFCSYDGTFPNRDPNPAVQKNLAALRSKVADCSADLGVAFDGDGDRAIFVDSDGMPLLAEEAMVIFIRHLVGAGESVVYDLKCSSILRQAVLEQKGTPIMERSGHAFIRRHFMEAHSRLAGEVSGHYFFRELEGDDGLFALVVMASILSHSQVGLRQLLADVRYTAITPDIRVTASPDEIDDVFARMETWASTSGAQVVRLDGIRLEFPDGSWVLLRRSITEPAYTLRLEAPNAQQLKEIQKTAAIRLNNPTLADIT